MESSRERLGLPVEKMSKTIHKYGNTSAASIPISLVDDLAEGKVKDDDVIVLSDSAAASHGALYVLSGENKIVRHVIVRCMKSENDQFFINRREVFTNGKTTCSCYGNWGSFSSRKFS